MLKLPVLHPEILQALGSAGHLAKVLVSDGNYPHSTRTNPRARLVWANFVPGVIDVVTALRMLVDLIPIEQTGVMAPERSGPYAMREEPPIWSEFRRVLREGAGFLEDLVLLSKPEFQLQAGGADVCLVIATAETQIYANLLLTIGVVR